MDIHRVHIVHLVHLVYGASTQHRSPTVSPAMREPIVCLCPGQGAQCVGMGKGWSAQSPEAHRIFDRADEVLGDSLGAPLTSLCFNGPADELNRTDVCQPALYVAGVASLVGLCEQWGAAPGGVPLTGAAGLSLGEYTALHIAGAIGFEDGLELVALRGRAMQDAADDADGSMVALIGADEGAAQEVCDLAREKSDDVLVCANFNAPGQVVISGDIPACERAVQIAGDKGLKATMLSVAGAFHSPLMNPARQRLEEKLGHVPIRGARCPVYSNVTGRPHALGNSAADADSVRSLLAAQLTSPVRWADGCRAMLSECQGVWHECAPGRTLAGLMRRIDRNQKVKSHDEPDEPDAP